MAAVWGSTPLLIRSGLEHFDHPVLGLTLGLGVSVPLFALLLALSGAWRRPPVPARARRWMMAGGSFAAVDR